MPKVKLMANGPGKCPVCGGSHLPKDEHDRESLLYLLRYYREHKRFPWEGGG